MPAIDASPVVPSRAVDPWTWRRVLRDHAEGNRDFLLAMLVLATYAGKDPFAYPSLRTWARSARMSVNTLRKHVERAERMGWIAVFARTGNEQANASRAYRFTVPEHIPLTPRDEELRDASVMLHGDAGVSGHA